MVSIKSKPESGEKVQKIAASHCSVAVQITSAKGNTHGRTQCYKAMTESQATKDTFFHYINPVCLSVGVIAFALYFEIELLDLGMWGLGLWGVTGILGLQKEGRIK